MQISQAFPSKYLKAADLQKRRHIMTMDRVVQEEGIDKPVLYFRGAQKGMALNKTNAMLICSLYGDDTENWAGQKIELYEASVSFNNQFVPAIRVMAPSQPDPNASPEMPAHGPTAPQGGGGYVPGGDLDDEIPF